MSDRYELTGVVAYALGWEWEEAPGVPSVAEVLSDVIDDIEAWLAARDARVKAEALEEAAAEIEEVDRIEHKPYRDTTTEEHAYYARYYADRQGVGKLAQASWLRARAAEYRSGTDALAT